MAAKKAPAKKMAAPKKSGNNGSANAAEKRVTEKKAKSRTLTRAESTAMGKGLRRAGIDANSSYSMGRDVGGYSGFGASSSSHLKPPKNPRTPRPEFETPAFKNAKWLATNKPSGKRPNLTSEIYANLGNTEKYAATQRNAYNKRTSGAGNFRKAEEAGKAAAKKKKK